MTVEQYAEMHGKQTDAVQVKLRRMFRGEKFSLDSELSAEHLAALSVDRRKSGKQSETKPAKVRATVAREVLAVTPVVAREKVVRQYTQKRRISIESIRAGLLSAILLAVIIGHGALIWYDCATLWGTAGLIGGGVVFLIVLAAVLLASDETRVRTSGTALYFALCIDICAWWVHFPTFQRPDVSDVITGALCAFLCACSWIALYLYRDKNLD